MNWPWGRGRSLPQAGCRPSSSPLKEHKTLGPPPHQVWGSWDGRGSLQAPGSCRPACGQGGVSPPRASSDLSSKLRVPGRKTIRVFQRLGRGRVQEQRPHRPGSGAEAGRTVSAANETERREKGPAFPKRHALRAPSWSEGRPARPGRPPRGQRPSRSPAERLVCSERLLHSSRVFIRSLPECAPGARETRKTHVPGGAPRAASRARRWRGGPPEATPRPAGRPKALPSLPDDAPR